jgi:hypothetical protein
MTVEPIEKRQIFTAYGMKSHRHLPDRSMKQKDSNKGGKKKKLGSVSSRRDQ